MIRTIAATEIGVLGSFRDGASPDQDEAIIALLDGWDELRIQMTD